MHVYWEWNYWNVTIVVAHALTYTCVINFSVMRVPNTCFSFNYPTYTVAVDYGYNVVITLWRLLLYTVYTCKHFCKVQFYNHVLCITLLSIHMKKQNF